MSSRYRLAFNLYSLLSEFVLCKAEIEHYRRVPRGFNSEWAGRLHPGLGLEMFGVIAGHSGGYLGFFKRE